MTSFSCCSQPALRSPRRFWVRAHAPTGRSGSVAGMRLLLALVATVAIQQTPAPSPVSSSSAAPEAATLEAEADARFARRSATVANGLADPREVDASIDLYRKATAASPWNTASFWEVPAGPSLPWRLHGRFDRREEDHLRGRPQCRPGRGGSPRGGGEDEGIAGQPRSMRSGPWTARRACICGRRGTGGSGRWCAESSPPRGAASPVACATLLRPSSIWIGEDAAGYRILGRLHSEAPKIPFITGWVSHDKGVELLRRSLAAAPSHPVTPYFLAEALLDHQPEKKDEAMRLLEACAGTPPRPEPRSRRALRADGPLPSRGPQASLHPLEPCHPERFRGDGHEHGPRARDAALPVLLHTL